MPVGLRSEVGPQPGEIDLDGRRQRDGRRVGGGAEDRFVVDAHTLYCAITTIGFTEIRTRDPEGAGDDADSGLGGAVLRRTGRTMRASAVHDHRATGALLPGQRA
ncbi:hypothetical protein GCM10009587_01170 [Microbacterium maritypicum]